MRQFALAAVGLAGLFVIGGLHMGHSHANAQGTQEGDPHTFAQYVHSALKTGDLVIVTSHTSSGHVVTLVRKDQVDQLSQRMRSEPKIVKELHADCVVLGQSASENTVEKGVYESVVPFDAICMFRKPMDNDTE